MKPTKRNCPSAEKTDEQCDETKSPSPDQSYLNFNHGDSLIANVLTMNYLVQRIPDRLSIPSGKVLICDPANPEEEPTFVVPRNSSAAIYYIDEPPAEDSSNRTGDCAALEIAFCTSNHHCSDLTQIGTVGVDSAQIMIADLDDVENTPEDPLFITELDPVVVANLVETFSLETAPLSNFFLEIISDERQRLFNQLSDYMRGRLGIDPDQHLFFNKWEFDLTQRILEGEGFHPFTSLGRSRMFSVSPNGSDGTYPVYAEIVQNAVNRCWIIMREDILTDGELTPNITEMEFDDSGYN